MAACTSFLWGLKGDVPGNVRHFGWLRLASVGVEIDCVVCYPGNPPACTGQRQPDLGNLIRTSLTQLPGNWARPGDVRHFGWCQANGPGQATLGILAGCGSPLFGVEIDCVVCQPSNASRSLWPTPAPQPCLAEPVHVTL